MTRIHVTTKKDPQGYVSDCGLFGYGAWADQPVDNGDGTVSVVWGWNGLREDEVRRELDRHQDVVSYSIVED